MKKIYFTLTGTRFFEGDDFIEPGMKIILRKDRRNEYDKEAILVLLEGVGPIGYVANSVGTVVGESFSAGRLYDKMPSSARGRVLYKMKRGILCELVTQPKNPIRVY